MTDDLKPFPPKKIPTRVKHFILERYLDAWGGIIIQSCPEVVHLRFVDTFCGAGLYQADPDAADEGGSYEIGSALLGPIKLLELVRLGRSKGRRMDAKALLINKARSELETVDLALPADVRGEVGVEVRVKRFDEVKDEVVDFCKRSFSFVLIDPYGPTIPFSSVAEIVRGKFTDALINFPFLTLQRWSGFLAKPTLSDDERRKLASVDAFMGGAEWRELAKRSLARHEPLDELLLGQYVTRLKGEEVFAITLPILFESINRPIYHLVFTTHNVAGLSAAKTSFVDAEITRSNSATSWRKSGRVNLALTSLPPRRQEKTARSKRWRSSSRQNSPDERSPFQKSYLEAWRSAHWNGTFGGR